MPVLESLLPSGLLATVVGGIVGFYAGAWTGGPITDFGPGGLGRPRPMAWNRDTSDDLTGN